MTGSPTPDPEATRNPGAGSDAGKRAYVTSTFRREQAFETMALACGRSTTLDSFPSGLMGPSHCGDSR